MKLGLVVFPLAVGGVDLLLEGREPVERMAGATLILALVVFVATGFLTVLPSAGAG